MIEIALFVGLILAAVPQDPQAVNVDRLGHPSYSVRERAARDLVRAGRLAKPALLLGRSHPDPEVRIRCERLLPAVLASDRQARLAAFLADPEHRSGDDLPGWPRFRSLAGQDAAARDLYARMLRAEGELLELADQAPEQARVRFAADCGRLQQRPAELASAAVLIFLAGRSDLHPDTMPMGVMVDQVFHQEAIRVGLSGPGAAPLRKLIVAYLETRSDPAAVHQAFHLATRHNMTELVPLAVRILRDPQQSAFTRGIAVLLVARVAGPGGRAELEPLLKDETPLTNFQWNGVRGTTELRDVALAGLVHLTNQSGKDYGFIALQKQPNPGLQSPYYLGFANDTARLAALTRWESWVAIQK